MLPTNRLRNFRDDRHKRFMSLSCHFFHLFNELVLIFFLPRFCQLMILIVRPLYRFCPNFSPFFRDSCDCFDCWVTFYFLFAGAFRFKFIDDWKETILTDSRRSFLLASEEAWRFAHGEVNSSFKCLDHLRVCLCQLDLCVGFLLFWHVVDIGVNEADLCRLFVLLRRQIWDLFDGSGRFCKDLIDHFQLA